VHRRLACYLGLALSCLSGCDAETADGGPSGGAFALGGGGSGGEAGPSGGNGGTMIAGGDCPADVELPAAARLPNVTGVMRGVTVRIRFDPRQEAADYRVYALPSPDDVAGDVIANATFRCAGDYALPHTPTEDEPFPQSYAIRTRIATPVEGFTRSADDAVLGYVFTTAGEGRAPVYALGEPALDADSPDDCYFQRYTESRVKRYVMSETERDSLLASRYRDDGIAFYVPTDDAADTRPIQFASEHAIYVAPGAELDQRAANGEALSAAFLVHASAVEGAEPLYRVRYEPVCARAHDELVATVARFEKAYTQGAHPIPELHWSGVTGPMTLVIEALDEQCPFQGLLSPMSRPAQTTVFETFSIDYPPFLTIDQIRALDPDGALFVNGQGDTSNRPHAVARACITIPAPELEPADFRYDGSSDAFGEAVSTDFQSWHLESDALNVDLYFTETNEWAIGSMLGELWMPHADWAADTNGKVRVTPKQLGALSADTFLHVTAEVDILSSERRYPQIIVSDQPSPVQTNLVNGVSLIFQPKGQVQVPLVGQIQLCDHRSWDVNNQCPEWELHKREDHIAPHLELGDLAGGDMTVFWDIYVSTKRAYMLTNGVPYGCVELPADRLQEGPATITFGDVLYHSSVDLAEWYPFYSQHMQTVTNRHFSNLTFTSDMPAPSWDETRFPCVPASGLGI
jgi:hypothetical protein